MRKFFELRIDGHDGGEHRLWRGMEGRRSRFAARTEGKGKSDRPDRRWSRTCRLSHNIPDAKTPWLFLENLVRASRSIIRSRFDKHLARSGYLAKGGQIVNDHRGFQAALQSG